MELSEGQSQQTPDSAGARSLALSAFSPKRPSSVSSACSSSDQPYNSIFPNMALLGPSSPAGHLLGLSTQFSSTTFLQSIVPRPLPTAATDALQDWELNVFLIDRYFVESNISMPMMSRSTFASSGPSSALLVASILLLTPVYIGGRPVDGTSAKRRESALARLAQQELCALLSSDRPTIDVRCMTAISNLLMWALFIGHPGLAWNLLSLASRIWQPLEPPGLPAPTSQRAEWVAYWERNCISPFLFAASMFFSNVTRDVSLIRELDVEKLLNFRAAPSWRSWEAAEMDDFDPASTEMPPVVNDCLRFLTYTSTDPRRSPHLAFFGSHVVGARMVPFWTAHIMRNRVDVFLAGCHKAGLEGPVALPMQDSPDLDPTLRHLVLMRNELDATLVQMRAAYPPEIDAALHACDANALIALIKEKQGSWHEGFNVILFFPALSMLRVELYTAVGSSYMSGDVTRLVEAIESLADPFSSGPLYTELLTVVVTFTRILEKWISLNPLLEFHHMSNFVPLIFMTLCLHASFHRKLQRSLITDSGSADFQATASDLLSQIDREVQVCLAVLRAYGKRWSSLERLYELALKLAAATPSVHTIVSASEMQEAKFLKDIDDAPMEGVDDLSSLLKVYLTSDTRTG